MSLLSIIKCWIGKLFSFNCQKKGSGPADSSSELIFPVLLHEDPAFIQKAPGVFMKGSMELGLDEVLDEDEGMGDFFPGGEEDERGDGNGGMVVPYERAPKLGI
ncbi:hypothetical protein ONS95_009568 [Cadophora gregata]|uniref:uncharacterized protein n=1 Tax=Cadophora gregata TaxID=51156 RepID=UPI0026DAA20E|nr:uncharacterized protein ONS95_009568 [Cadophora gregata]KAK0124620.1 hypothetical protein ONS95_009568 [Cadophora gregata]KAK0129523.1 hypothetical protein ONS96_000089 [Cadophora gregata f. sp. sojae]